jgi:hypothetical protein
MDPFMPDDFLIAPWSSNAYRSDPANDRGEVSRVSRQPLRHLRKKLPGEREDGARLVFRTSLKTDSRGFAGSLMKLRRGAVRSAGERRYFTPSRSTSKISVAPGGMTPPAPLAP